MIVVVPVLFMIPLIRGCISYTMIITSLARPHTIIDDLSLFFCYLRNHATDNGVVFVTLKSNPLSCPSNCDNKHWQLLRFMRQITLACPFFSIVCATIIENISHCRHDRINRRECNDRCHCGQKQNTVTFFAVCSKYRININSGLACTIQN